MKFNDISANSPQKKRGIKMKKPVVTKNQMLIDDKQKTRKRAHHKPAASSDSTIHLYAGTAEPGHEVHRLKKTHPHIWHKIKNWD